MLKRHIIVGIAGILALFKTESFKSSGISPKVYSFMVIFMGDIKIVPATSIKVGSYLIVDGVASKVVSLQISRPGKHGHAKVRIDAVGLIDGRKRSLLTPGHENVEVPIIEKKQAQVLTVNGDSANVMDSESFETFDLKIPEELKDQVIPGVNVVYWEILDERVMKQVKNS